MNNIKVFAKNNTFVLVNNICKKLNIELAKSNSFTFSNGEIGVNIEESVRGDDVFIIYSTYSNDLLLELMIMIDALKRASARRITAVIPFFGYARQDRKARPREPITAKLVADLLTTAGADRILTIDLHVDQIQGFFNIPVDHLTAIPLLANYFKEKLFDMYHCDDIIVVSPDHGGVTRSRRFAKQLNCDLAIIDKRRDHNNPNQSEVINIIGNVKNKICILVDDMIDTAGTIGNASKALRNDGALTIFACATHPVLSGKYNINMFNSCINEFIFTDTIPIHNTITSRYSIVSVDQLLADAIKRIHNEESVSELFM